MLSVVIVVKNVVAKVVQQRLCKCCGYSFINDTVIAVHSNVKQYMCNSLASNASEIGHCAKLCQSD